MTYFFLFTLLASLATLAFSGQLGSSILIQASSFILSIISLLFIHQLMKTKKLNIGWIIVISILAPSLFIVTPASDDINRYIWEAQVIENDLNPYYYAPNSIELVTLRDSTYWPDINHKDLSAAYPPLSINIFRYTIGLSKFCWPFETPFSPYYALKFLMLISYLLSIGFLFLIARKTNIPYYRILFWSTNPFALYFMVGESHLDILMITALIFAYYLHLNKKFAAVSFFLGLSICIKYFSIIAIPLFIHKDWKLKSLIGLLPFFLFLLYSDYFESIIDFGLDYHFNGFIHSIIQSLFGKTGLYLAVALVVVVLFFHGAVESKHYKNLLYTSLILTCLLPTVHPWYLCLSIPWLVFHSSISLWVLQISTFLFLLPMYHINFKTGVFQELGFYSYFIWMPFLVSLTWEMFFKKNKSIQNFKKIKTIDIIIPIHNESENLLEFNNKLTMALSQLESTIFSTIYTHSGANDGCLEIAQEHKLNWFQSPKLGRGYQVNYAMQESSSDLVFILHVDTQFPESLFKDIVNQMNEAPHYYSGWCPMDFDHQEGLSFVRILNSFRANTLEICFGDQLQFFRREAIEHYKSLDLDIIPAMPLMEDVELSMKLKELGPTLRSNTPIKVSARRWQGTNRWKNAFLIVKITSIYLFARRLGLAPSQSTYFQQQYYGK